MSTLQRELDLYMVRSAPLQVHISGFLSAANKILINLKGTFKIWAACSKSGWRYPLVRNFLQPS